MCHASSAGLFGPREADRSSEGQREVNKRTPLGPTVSDFTHSKFYRPVAAMVKALVQPDRRNDISMPALFREPKGYQEISSPARFGTNSFDPHHPERTKR